MLKVLLVDDEPFIIQGLKVIIDWENEEFEIAGTASNGKEALQFLENENVDLVIADIRMPEMTGLELLETLRKDKKSDVYFVILSGYADFSYAKVTLRVRYIGNVSCWMLSVISVSKIQIGRASCRERV